MQNDLEWPVLPILQLFQSFPIEVAQNESEWLISPISQLFQSFPTEVAQNDSEQPILSVSQYYIPNISFRCNKPVLALSQSV